MNTMAANELPQLSGSVYTSSLLNCGDFSGTVQNIVPSFTDFRFTPEVEIAPIMPNQTNRRIVQVFIADPNENIPLEKSLLYQDEKPFLTDLTDQELFYEIDIKSVLDQHNAYRVTVKDKEASGKDNAVMLEKAKIRDLKMTVVTVASF